MLYLVLTALVTVACAIGIPLTVGRSREGRWGTRRGAPVPAGTSPYREGVLRAELPNGAPWALRFTSGANAAWAVLTMMIFAPAGLLLLLFTADEAPLAALPLLAVCVDGFVLGGFLLGSARALLRREKLDEIPKRATWSLLHHGAVMLTMLLIGLLSGEWFMAAMSAVPCGVGIGLAVALRGAARKASRLGGELPGGEGPGGELPGGELPVADALG